MVRTIGEVLAKRASEGFVGRERELAALHRLIEPGGQLVVQVHGIPGVGKTSLLQAFGAQARSEGATVIWLDCGGIEPTERGFLHKLGAAIGAELTDADAAAARLGSIGRRVVLVLDTYEVFRLMDTWLRQDFIPALPSNVRVAISGREPPVPAWLTRPEWRGLFLSLALNPLNEKDALTLLRWLGVPEGDARRVNVFARGLPLALTLAAATRGAGVPGPGETASQQVVDSLTRQFLADIDEPAVRRALEAASLVRRVSLSLLKAMLPDQAPVDLYERIAALPFVLAANDGLVIHDAVRQTLAASLKASDPSGYLEYRRRAWRQLRDEIRGVPAVEMWRYTADMLYMIESHMVRDAFFPHDAPPIVVEPATRRDGDGILAIARRHEGPEEAGSLKVWWDCHPDRFTTVRDGEGNLLGFFVLSFADLISKLVFEGDPVAREWQGHLRSHPVPEGQRAMLARRWLSDQEGELPSPVQAASWIEVKRTYMVARPQLRRVYMSVCNIETYGPVATRLGFKGIPESSPVVDGQRRYLACLDFGPASVDGWIAGIVAADLGIVEPELLDIDAREVSVDGRRVPLTPLEFGLMRTLVERQGKVVSRAELIEAVWGYSYTGGSNVVEAVVRTLRKKLGPQAHTIEAVRGVGYRLQVHGAVVK